MAVLSRQNSPADTCSPPTQKRGLPRQSIWRHGDICVLLDEDPEKGMHLTDEDMTNEAPLPLGVPIPFESDLFVGTMVIRVKGVQSDNPQVCEKYFEGRKRMIQNVVQGRFKKPVDVSQVKLGDIYDEPFHRLPPKWMMQPVFKFFESIRPGIQMDMYADKPRVLVPVGGCQTLRVDLPGQEPDIVNEMTLREETSLLFDTKYANNRKFRQRELSNPKTAKNYVFSPDHVVTIETYDDFLDLKDWKMKVGLGTKIDIDQATSGQPFSTTMVRVNNNTGSTEFGYRFQVHHHKDDKERAK